MWSAEHGTDGHVPSRYLRFLHPDGEHTEAQNQLVAAGLWEREAAGMFMPEWSGALHQSTAAEVEAYKAGGRARQQKWRDRQREKLTKAVSMPNPSTERIGSETDAGTGDVTRNVTGAVTRPSMRDVGKGKGKGQALDAGTTRRPAPTPTLTLPTVDSAAIVTWATAAIPGAVPIPTFPTCRVCGQAAQTLDAWGLCSKTTAPHAAARRQVA